MTVKFFIYKFLRRWAATGHLRRIKAKLGACLLFICVCVRVSILKYSKDSAESSTIRVQFRPKAVYNKIDVTLFKHCNKSTGCLPKIIIP